MFIVQSVRGELAPAGSTLTDRSWILHDEADQWHSHI